MNLLLDTHTLIWSLSGDRRLSVKSREIIGNTKENLVFVRVVSIWEIRIKQSLNRLEEVPKEFYGQLRKIPLHLLPITPEHANAIGDLPLIHRDPFDRMLIAQAKQENLILMTRDQVIQQYDVVTLKP